MSGGYEAKTLFGRETTPFSPSPLRVSKAVEYGSNNLNNDDSGPGS